MAIERRKPEEVISRPEGGYIAPIKPPVAAITAGVVIGAVAMVAGAAQGQFADGCIIAAASVGLTNLLSWPGRILNRPTSDDGAEAWERYHQTGQK